MGTFCKSLLSAADLVGPPIKGMSMVVSASGLTDSSPVLHGQHRRGRNCEQRYHVGWL
jgi:hypothetical protein